MTNEPIKFLLVDDVPNNLVALEGLLRREGLELLKAANAREALELLLVHDVALALIDVQMPEMDGFELAELMRGAERTKHVPIIFVTAGPRDPERVFQGYDTGAVDFLFKPIDPHVLKSKADVFFDLYRQRRELTNLLRLHEMFVGVLGHDLRNPLATMVTGAKVLRPQVGSDKHRITLDRMVAAGERMTAMIEQLLDLTRARLGGGLATTSSDTPVDAGELVRRTCDELKIANPDTQLVIEVVGDTRIRGDSDRLMQLFSNLIGNAVKHGESKAPVQIDVDGNEAELVAVRVRNAGVVPASLLPVLFDPFRGRESNTRNGGLGLGLYIGQQIARAHGGSITATTCESSRQTEFTVRLPRAGRG